MSGKPVWASGVGVLGVVHEEVGSPIAYWRFDENTGSTVYDVGSSGADGTVSGTSWSSDAAYGTALDFNGTSAYVDTTNNNDLFTSNGTVSGWVKTTNDSNDMFWSANDTNDTAWFAIALGDGATNYLTNEIVTIITGNTTTSTVNRVGFTDTDRNILFDGNWHHIAVTAGDVYEIYIDGVPRTVTTGYGSNNGSFTDITGLDNTRLGARDYNSGGPADYFDGVIDEVRIYDRALDESEIRRLAQNTPAAAAHYKFDEGYGTTVHDSYSYYNNGAINGASWTNDGKYGKALEFDGTDDYVGIADSDLFTFSNGSNSDEPFSISSWINMDDATDFNIFSKGDSTNREYRFIVDSGDDLNVILYDSTASHRIEKETTQTLTSYEGSWVHVTATYDGSSSADGINLYINGALADSTTSVGGTYVAMHNQGAPAIARLWNNGTLYLDGLIDEFKIYKHALTPQEVELEFNQGKSIVLGSTSTESDGTTSSLSSSREYCVPGDTSTCDPPVGEWLMDENTGTSTTYDTSGNGNHSTLGTIDESQWVPGKVGSALDFDGVDDYIIVPQDGTSHNELTTSKWFKADTVSGTVGFFQWADSLTDTGPFILAQRDSSDLKIYVEGGYRLTQAISVDTWYQLTIVYDTTDLWSFYLNGTLIGTYQGDGTPSNQGTADYAYFGNGYNGYFDGVVDQVRIYDYARTPAQIAWEYNKGAPVAHYKFDECQGTTVYDSSVNANGDSNGNTGTLTIGGSGSNTSVGTCSSGTGTEAWNNGTTGKYSSAMDFDGTDDQVELGLNAVNGMADGVSAITVSAWVNPDSLSTTQYFNNIFTSLVSTSYWGVSMNIEGADGNKLRIGGASQTAESWQNAKGTSAIPTGEWTHVLGVVDIANDEISVYVNGVHENTDSVTFASDSYNPGVATYSDVIGAYHDDNAFFDGSIDEFQIYGYALTDAQVRNIYNANSAVRFE